MRRWLVALVFASCLIGVRAARAEKDWPVRLNVSMPLGYTFGSEKLHGFTWGFRGIAHAYPTGRGIALGGYAEMLIDTQTHSMSSFGGSVSVPVRGYELDESWDMDWRVGGYGGVRYSSEGNDPDARLATGMFTELAIPAYLYEFRIGVRIDGTFHDGLSSTSILLDLDLIGLIGLVAWGAGGK